MEPISPQSQSIPLALEGIQAGLANFSSVQFQAEDEVEEVEEEYQETNDAESYADDDGVQGNDSMFRPSVSNLDSTGRPSQWDKENVRQLIGKIGFQTDTHWVELSQLSYIPGSVHKKFLGRICHHFIKESNFVLDLSLGCSGMGGLGLHLSFHRV
jgi:hypothetical protein